MGRGPAWLVVENMALIKAWLIEANNPIRGTDQSGKEFWGRVLKGWTHALRNETDANVKAARDQRGLDALRKQWAKMVAGVMEFSSSIVQARKAKPTGITSHADLVNCAEGLYCGTNIYGRIRGDHADDVATGKKTKRHIKRVTCPWAQYWEQLKDQDRFKSAAAEFAALQKKSADAHVRAAARAAAAAETAGGGPAAEQAAAEGDPAPAAAANAAAAGTAGDGAAPKDADESNDDDDQGPWAGRPIGSKAAKRARAESIADDRTIGRVASAVEKLGDATAQRTSMMAFSLPFMRETPMGVAFWAHQAKKMLAKEGIKVPSPKQAADASAASDGAGTVANKDKVAAPEKAAKDDISGTENVAADDDVTIVGDNTSSAPPPPPPATPASVEQTTGAASADATTPTSRAGSTAGASAVTMPEAAADATAGASQPAASTSAAAAPAPAAPASTPTSEAAAAAMAATAAAALPARAAAKDVHKQRGRREQSTKRKKAAAAMDAPLKTTVDLTVSAAAPNGARPPPAAAAEAEAAAAPVIPQSAPPSAGRKRRAPPPESFSDDSVSDGGGFDGFDSDLIDSFARNGGRSSSEFEEE